MQEIQNSRRHILWRHCKSELNSGDLASRGMSAKDILHCEKWWSPQWLTLDESQWPQSTVTVPDNLPGFKKLIHITTQVESWEDSLLSRFSSYNKIINITAYVIRFCKNIRLPKE